MTDRTNSESVPSSVLDEVEAALRRCSVAFLTVAPRLETPFPDAPEWSPWTRTAAPAGERAEAALKGLREARAPLPLPGDEDEREEMRFGGHDE